MKAIILAAGSGTRLRSKDKELPKGFLEINGQTILERQIALFKKFNIENITIITGPHREKFNLKTVSYLHDEYYSKHDEGGVEKGWAEAGYFSSAIEKGDAELIKSVKEDINDPVLMKTRASQMKRDKIEADEKAKQASLDKRYGSSFMDKLDAELDLKAELEDLNHE